MKSIKIIVIVTIGIFFQREGLSQNLNWAHRNSSQRHVLNVNLGFDYAFSYGVGYGYRLKTKFPVVLGLEHSQPAGEKVFDDFKTKIGGQVRVYQINNFHLTAKVYGIFRRYENDYVRLLNFGSDISAIIGYYKSKWFVAAEFGFDKAIVTNFKHSDLFKEDFPLVKDGWYEPATGGNFHYGLQVGLSFSKADITMKLGKVIQQDFKSEPNVPLYFQLGYNIKF
ncbi:MAG TPA: hypothetical protein VFZ52_17920 [Chryseolinea sp.]